MVVNVRRQDGSIYLVLVTPDGRCVWQSPVIVHKRGRGQWGGWQGEGQGQRHILNFSPTRWLVNHLIWKYYFKTMFLPAVQTTVYNAFRLLFNCLAMLSDWPVFNCLPVSSDWCSTGYHCLQTDVQLSTISFRLLFNCLPLLSDCCSTVYHCLQTGVQLFTTAFRLEFVYNITTFRLVFNCLP